MKTNRCHLVALTCAFLAILLLAPRARGELLVPPHLIPEHGGIGVPYLAGHWDLKAVDGRTEPPVDFTANEALFHLNENTIVSADEIPTRFHSWLGTSPGQTVYVVPQTLEPATPFFGFNLHGMTEADKAALAPWEPADPRLEALHHHHDDESSDDDDELEAWIQIDLLNVRGLGGTAAPGEFSLWTASDEGLAVWMSTAQPPAEGNRFYLDVEHGHSHVNWGFTAPGVYELEIQATTYLAAAPEVSITSPATTFYFGVLHAVPEPSGAAMLLFGGAAVVLVQWRAIHRRGIA